MLTVYQSNSIDRLKQLLVGYICANPLPDPFADEYILVQSPGMAQWLQQQIAISATVAAAIKFPLPATFIWQLFQQLLPDVPGTSSFSKETMTWKLMHLLPECFNNPVFAPLQDYLTDDPNQIKIYQLATKIADTFDQYLVYRPDWIQAWEKGDDLKAITSGHPWQPVLWRKLTAFTQDLKQSHWHRGNLFSALVDALESRDTMLTGTEEKALPKRLFIFGLSTLPPAYLQVLQAIGNTIEVHLMVHNPCQHFWGDTVNPRFAHKRSGAIQVDFFDNDNSTTDSNSLLASMGTLGRDYHFLLSELQAHGMDCFEDPLEADACAEESATVLKQIQSHIFNLEEPGAPAEILPADQSLTINDCHSPLREAEVLHDYLLNLLENDPALTPKNIIIMAPDIEAYSPAIQAVFSSAPRERHIPFAISDLNACRENPMLESLLKILSCHQLRCTVAELITILEVPSVMRRFSIKPSDLTTLRHWITSSGIRWGLNTQQQVKQDLPAEHQNSWLFGLERMLLGYTMDSQDTLYANTLPVEDLEGRNASLCGPLIEFITQLSRIADILEQPRSANDWTKLINQILDMFFLPDTNETHALQMVRDIMESLCEQTDDADFNDQLSHAVTLQWLKEHLDHHRVSQRFLSGKVNVCTLMPMRSIPFKVICLLGMNDGDYPRSVPPDSFDLITGHARKGDRSRRNDDRYLFLEAILAAEENLYISYNGHNIKDNSDQAPSVLVSELINYCEKNFRFKEEKPQVSNIEISNNRVIKHPLQPFSKKYFQRNNPFFTYANEWLSSAAQALQKIPAFISAPLAEKEIPLMLDLDDLLQFYRHPCKYFFRHRLGVVFEEMETPPDDEEPFEIKGLDGFKLQEYLLKNILKKVPADKTLALIKAEGKLPHSHFGSLALDQIQKPLEALGAAVLPFISCPQPDKKIHLDIHGLQISGWIKGIYKNEDNNTLIRYRPGRSKNKLLVSSLIEHLIWCASTDTPGETKVFCLSGNNKKEAVSTTELPALTKQQSMDELNKLFSVFRQGQNRPVPFLPETSALWITLGFENGQRSTCAEKLASASQKIRESFEEAIRHDMYIGRTWTEFNDELFEEITALAEMLLSILAPPV